MGRMHCGAPLVMTIVAGCAELATLKHAAHLLPPDPPLLGGYQAHSRQIQRQIHRPSPVNNTNDPIAYEAPHTSHCSLQKVPNPPENLNKATETFSRDFSEGTPAGGFKARFLVTFSAEKVTRISSRSERRNAFDFEFLKTQIADHQPAKLAAQLLLIFMNQSQTAQPC